MPPGGQESEVEQMAAYALEELWNGRPKQPRQLVEVLLDTQERDGFLSEEALREVSRELSVPLIEVWRVANYYKALSVRPRGKHLITVCMGTACHVRSAALLLEECSSQLGIATGDTSADRLFTVEKVNCLGACALGPIAVLDGAYHHHMTPSKLRRLIRSATKAEKETVSDAVHDNPA
jgi:NADH:ubiquinone oxidoreductase subunit E